jgi:hypothetical protein
MKSAVEQAAIERLTDGARMAKRNNGDKQTTAAAAVATPQAATSDPIEQRMLAFAEQLGRIVGTVQAKAEGWMDRDALNQQIAGVRDSASELLDQLKTTVTNAATGDSASGSGSGEAAKNNNGAKAPTKSTGDKSARLRTRGLVNAPGKKHRKPMPKDARTRSANAKAGNQRAGKTMVKTGRLRGRG